MTTSSTRITFINTFHTNGREDQENLVARVRQETETVTRHLPGFLSATLYRSMDGKTVTNVAEWRSAQEFKQAIEHPAMLAFREETRPLYQPVGYLCQSGVSIGNE